MMKIFLWTSLWTAMVTANPQTTIVPINGYMPVTDVSHEMALADDMGEMNQLIFDRNYHVAERVYNKGGNSLSFANLVVKNDQGLPVDIEEGALLEGLTVNGKSVTGRAKQFHAKGSTVLSFVYPFKGDENTVYNCKVGGLSQDSTQKNGCLKAQGDVQTEFGETIQYEYVVEEDNVNGFTLASLSTLDNKRMRPNPEAPYFETFQPFVDYYGTYKYADEIVKAGFQASDTNLKNDNFYMSAEPNDFDGRNRVIYFGVQILSVGMNVLRELEWSVYQCQECAFVGNGSCEGPNAAVHSVDRAVAFYNGVSGHFFHHLANQRCGNFGTCNKEGEAQVNIKVMGHMKQMQASVQAGDCLAARDSKDAITRLMWIPLIQGNLRYAWMLSDANPNNLITSKGHQAQGAVNAAAILPIIYKCNQDAADIVHRNMQVRENGIVDDFVGVKAALESCYEFLGITCADVGGIKDHPLTMPCKDASTTKSKKGNVGKAFGLLILVLVLIGGGIGVFLYFKKNKPSGSAGKDIPEQAPEQPLPKAGEKEVV